jgi:hypothetical protein
VNYLTLEGLELDSGSIKQPTTLQSRRIEFIGDSITAGYCNMCKDTSIITSGQYAYESFAASWPYIASESLNASYRAIGR